VVENLSIFHQEVLLEESQKLLLMELARLD